MKLWTLLLFAASLASAQTENPFLPDNPFYLLLLR